VKFIETSAIDGNNIEEAFVMLSRDIHARLQSGELQVADGWDGIKHGALLFAILISI
jgi:Ras-related protein Rab-39B